MATRAQLVAADAERTGIDRQVRAREAARAIGAAERLEHDRCGYGKATRARLLHLAAATFTAALAGEIVNGYRGRPDLGE